MQKKQLVIAGFNSPQKLLSHHAEKYGRKEAIIAYDPDTEEIQKISYKNLYELAYKTAAFLESNGIKKNSRFAILMHNSAEVLLFELGGALIGATCVPLDYKRDTLERKIYKLQETKSKALFVKKDNSSQQDIADIKKAFLELKIFTWESWNEYMKIITGSSTIRGAHSVTPEMSLTRSVNNFESTYVILYTSGTTAHPKGAILTTRACLLNAEGIAKWQKFNDRDRFNIVLPLHHINSTIFCLSIILVGGTIILTSRYSASKFWKIVERFKVTNTSVVPTILHDLLMRYEEFNPPSGGKKLNISSFKRICIGSAPVLPEETLKFYKTFGVRVVQGYGQTETALRVAGVPVDVPEKKYVEMVKNNTIGDALANNELAIMDSHNNWKKENEEGEICIKGEILAGGYLNDIEASRHAFKNGWFHSGDLGKYKIIDGKKYFFIIGRIKEIIIKGGVNLSPSAIEDGLLKSYGEINEVAVVGIPDERMGEEVAAVIVPRKGVTSAKIELLKQDILSKNNKKLLENISLYELPKKVFILEELPKTSTGKIQRVVIKKMIGELLAKENSNRFYVRKINPDEEKILSEAVSINNSRFMGLPATIAEFRQRATNGILFGAFEEKGGLAGTISCVRLSTKMVDKFKTWDEATRNGTLINNDPKGDTVLCVAISMRSNSRQQITNNKINNLLEYKIKRLAKKYIRTYVNSGTDHVINFHMKPKGGLAGASVWRILENGRKEDKESMGYNVLMKYPVVDRTKKIKTSQNAAPSILLIEEVLNYAQKHGIKNVIAFSRPAGFRGYLLKEIN